MLVKDGICYPNNQTPILSVAGCSIVDESRMRVRFSTGETRIVDVSPLFQIPIFASLKNRETLQAFSIDHGVLCWQDGDIDIAPEWLFDHGIKEVGSDISDTDIFVAEDGLEYDSQHTP